MTLFRRRRQPTVQHRVDEHLPDPVLAFLTVGQAATVRTLTRAAFAECGIEVVVHPGHVEASDGVQYGLNNIAALCHTLPRREWPEAVHRHVSTVLAAATSPSPDQLSNAEMLSRVFVRVMSQHNLPGDNRYGYRRDLGGGLVEVLAVDYENHVAIVPDDVVSRFDVDELRHAGVANLLSEPFGNYQKLRVDRRASFGLLTGESVYTASRLLTMTDVLRRTIGSGQAPDGVLACVPNRHQLAFHLLTDSSAIPALGGLARFAVNEFSESVGSVSPYVFWYRDGRLEQLSRVDPEGNIRIEVRGEFARVLERLAGREAP